MGGCKTSCSVDSGPSKAPQAGATTGESADDTKVVRLVLSLLVRSQVARDENSQERKGIRR